MMISENKVADAAENDERLIELIYQAASEPELWPELLKQLYLLTQYSPFAEPTQISGYPLFDALDGHAPSNPLQDNPKFKRVFRHLSLAIKITKKLYAAEENHQLLHSLLNRIPVGLILVSEDGTIQSCNSLGNEMLIKSHYLGNSNNKLTLKDPHQNQEMMALIKELSKTRAFDIQSRGMLIKTHESQLCPMLVITPLNMHALSIYEKQAKVAVFLSSSNYENSLELSALADIYQLTPKELRIVEHIVRGISPPNIAKTLHVSYNTVRTQLKSIYQKVGVNKQSELVNRILTGPASMLFQCHNNDDTEEQLSPLDQSITLSDGRNLCYRERGQANGEPVLLCHSIIGSRMECFDLRNDWAKRVGVRLIIPDRPGYGYSDPNPNLSYRQWHEDAIELMDQLKIERFSLIGYAVGGNYACELALQKPERIKQMILISAGSPLATPDDYHKATPLFMMQVQLAKHYPQLYRLFLVLIERGLHKTPSYYIDLLASKINEYDRILLNESHVQRLVQLSCAEVGRQGVNAFVDEIRRYTQEKQINYSKIKTPTLLWHGRKSSYVSLTTAEKIRSEIPKSEINIIENAGHILIYQYWPDIIRDLKDRIKKSNTLED
ncbi:bifunctional helix-turn-helix transcriptional regulator/alpha/beta hydrolase [Celerinatantimonas diazotrophica]|uniref:Pimeloyl-ACP methyl ester carboxylesterase n=1 Tax=Celerinatantimonas diazotrophica TaxID=412034 RepID=A0A4R1K3Z3_9GAMM|nr:alpha/beta fold hydrolase [Celerinatantimonas diazotrophica]TCK58828.1 pimeloyl-ACP methyl ester carboxylesterase [Celerinatantimonas diazotrophica]CAG9297460.1 2-succinyl-6-hydroxy-2, 4-cyclohexadiene-1-carboxylate synthase [Celerinatantimonas diazotrophica]